MRQVGTRKALHRKSRKGFTAEASLFAEVASEPGVTTWPGMSLAVARIAGQVVPGAEVARAWSAALVRNVGWRAPTLPLPRKGRGERENPKRLKREGLSTVAGRAGGPARSSGETPA